MKKRDYPALIAVPFCALCLLLFLIDLFTGEAIGFLDNGFTKLLALILSILAIINAIVDLVLIRRKNECTPSHVSTPGRRPGGVRAASRTAAPRSAYARRSMQSNDSHRSHSTPAGRRSSGMQ